MAKPVRTAYQGYQAKPVCRAGLAYWGLPEKPEYLARWGRAWVKLGSMESLLGCQVWSACLACLLPAYRECPAYLAYLAYHLLVYPLPAFPGFHLGLGQ